MDADAVLVPLMTLKDLKGNIFLALERLDADDLADVRWHLEDFGKIIGDILDENKRGPNGNS